MIADILFLYHDDEWYIIPKYVDKLHGILSRNHGDKLHNKW